MHTRSGLERSCLLLAHCAAVVALVCGATGGAVAHPVEPPPTTCVEGVTGFLYQGARTKMCILGVGDVDLMEFDASPGDVVRVVITSLFVDLHVVVRDRDGVMVGEVADCNGGEFPDSGLACLIELDVGPLSRGTYEIEVTDSGADEFWNYTMQIEALPPKCIPELESGAVDTFVCVSCPSGGNPSACWFPTRLFGLDKGELFEYNQTLDPLTDIDHITIEVAEESEVTVRLGPGRDVRGDWRGVDLGALEPKVEVFDDARNKLGEATCPSNSPPNEYCASVTFSAGGGDCSEEEPCNYIARVSDDLHDDGSPTVRYYTNVTRVPEPAAHVLGAVSLAVIVLLSRARRAPRLRVPGTSAPLR